MVRTRDYLHIAYSQSPQRQKVALTISLNMNLQLMYPQVYCHSFASIILQSKMACRRREVALPEPVTKHLENLTLEITSDSKTSRKGLVHTIMVYNHNLQLFRYLCVFVQAYNNKQQKSSAIPHVESVEGNVYTDLTPTL